MDRVPEAAMNVNMRMASFLLAALSSTAHAQDILMCKDAYGKTFTSDRPIPECSGRAVRQLDRNGLVRRDIPAARAPRGGRRGRRGAGRGEAGRAGAAGRRQQDK